jgi:hypothetical protein
MDKRKPIQWKKEFITMLNAWQFLATNSFIERPDDKHLVKHTGPRAFEYFAHSEGTDADVVAVQADRPLRPFPLGDLSVGYYELTVVSRGADWYALRLSFQFSSCRFVCSGF